MTTRFPIRYSRLNAILLGLMGMGRRRSSVEVDGDVVRVRMGWAFRATFPARSVVEVGRRRRVFSWGAHGWRGRWIVNGSGRDLLILHLDPARRARVMGVAVKLKGLEISLEDPEAFLRAIGR